MFSVLMSLYFKENPVFLDECFKSIWSSQSLKPTEIILVLDGPIDDDLMKIVNKWELILSTILKIIPIQKNVGLGKALNEGLKYCTNEWVFRMDTDDICMPDRFEKQIQFIKDNPEISLFSGQILEFNETLHDAHILKTVPIKNDEIIKTAQKRCPFNHMAVAYKKTVVQSVGSYQHHPFMEDYNLWLRIIGAGYKVANHPDVLLYARVGNGMHARRKGIEYIKSEKQLLDLKKKLKMQSLIYGIILFLIRSAFRLLPSSFLGKVYNNFLRKKVSN